MIFADQSQDLRVVKNHFNSELSLKKKCHTFRRELPPTEWPIHLEISCNEGPQIQTLNNTINNLIDRITESADLSAGEEILAARSHYIFCIFLHYMKKDFYCYDKGIKKCEIMIRDVSVARRNFKLITLLVWEDRFFFRYWRMNLISMNEMISF